MLPRLITLLLLASSVHSYNILVYNPKFGHSHSNYIGRIADLLVDAGHNVTTLIPIIDPTVADGTTKSHVIHIAQTPGTKTIQDIFDSDSPDFDIWEDLESSPLNSIFGGQFMKAWLCEECAATLDEPGLVEKLTDVHFDLVITENFDFCGMGLSHAIGAKATILVVTSAIYEFVAFQLGIPVVPSYNPSYAMENLDSSSIVSRAYNAYIATTTDIMWRPTLRCENDHFKHRFGADYPDIEDLTADTAYVFTNTEPLIDFARPTLRKVIELGGIGIKAPKTLDKSWDAILSQRKINVLVSFGSIAKSIKMKPGRKLTVLRTLARFPNVTFIWKYEEPDDDFAKEHVAKVKNVVLTKWMPQNDLLADPRVTAFISHGGMGSVQEAATRGVPTLFVPIFAEQGRNAAMMAHNGIGLLLNKYDALDDEKFVAEVDKLLHTESLYVNAKKTAAMLARRPFTPQDLLIKHVEFAAEFGASKALTPRGLQLGWIQYFLVDIIAIAILAGALVISLVFYCTYRIFRKCVSPAIVKTKQS